ncbi:MAG: aspartate aminotransferase family protein [Thermomicrobiales bacterium]|nr:aspartate aminotransferase family protein [Thermomicrobiales bacterium]
MNPNLTQPAQDAPRLDVDDAELRQLALDHVWVHSAAWEDLNRPGGLKIIVEGDGAHVVDSQGRRYLDACSGLWCVNVGYGRQEIADAMRDQALRLPYARASGFTSPPTARLAKKIADLAPGSLTRSFFVGGGTEAVETAVKMARQYHALNGQPGRHKIIGRRHSYHGASLGAMAISSSPLINRSLFEPLPAGVRHLSGPYCYRCDYQRTYPDCNVFCARTYESMIQFEGPDSIAAIIAEPISNSSGVIVPPDEYWPVLRALCDKYGILLIVDEVVTGFGRTGKMFGIEHWGVVPDIMAVAKGLSSAYVPIGAAVAREEIAAKFRPGKPEAFQHVVTFGGHAVACAGALANLEIIERDNLVENSARLGRLLLDGLHALAAEHPTVGDVRGKGLMIGIEIVRDRSTRASFQGDDRLRMRKIVNQQLDAAGILASVIPSVGDVLPLLPPLMIGESEADQLLGAVDDCLTRLESEFDITR